MTDGVPLGQHTVMIVDRRGILGIWCSGQCLKDMHAMGILRDFEEDVIDRIDGRKPSVDEGPTEDG